MDTDESRPLRKHSKSFRYPRIVVDGYLYHFHKRCKYHLRWKCNRVFATKCPSVLLTTLDLNNLQLLCVDHDHSHSNDMCLIDSIKAGTEKKSRRTKKYVDQGNTLIIMKAKKVIDQQNGKRLYPYDNKREFEKYIKRSKFNNMINEYRNSKNKIKPEPSNLSYNDTLNQIKTNDCVNQNNKQLNKYQLGQKKTSVDLKNTIGTNSQISITLQNSNSVVQCQRTPVTSVSTTKLSHQNLDSIQEPNTSLILSPKDLKDDSISKLLSENALQTFSGHELPLAQINSNKGTVTISLVNKTNNRTNSSIDPPNVCISKENPSHDSIESKTILSSFCDTTSIDNGIKKEIEFNSSTTITPVEFKEPLPNTFCQDNTIDLTGSGYDDNIKNIQFLKPVPSSIPIFPTVNLIKVPQTTIFFSTNLINLPPTPKLEVKLTDPRYNNGHNANVLLTWNVNLGIDTSTVQSYEIYAFEYNLPYANNVWTLIGEVQALPLPMACTLRLMHKTDRIYYFSVRAKDIHNRFSLFSTPDYVSY